MLRIGADIGGTFTDVIGTETGSGRSVVAKVLSTPNQPGQAVLTGLQLILDKFNTDSTSIEAFVHASTLVTNAIIERKGAKTGLLTTSGFRDVLEMGHEYRYDLYDLFIDKPEPLVPRRYRREIPERILADGTVFQALDKDAVVSEARQLILSGVESLAVCLLHSYANPSHEQQIGNLLAQEWPELDVTLSSTVAPVIREYERASTTVANAYVRPLVRRYLEELNERLTKSGAPSPRIMLSNGGITSVDLARVDPIRMLESGPAAGAIAAALVAEDVRSSRLISFDMGGTTAKMCVIDDARPVRTNSMEAARLARFRRGSGLPLHVPVVELIEIGAGGGSIARIDKMGLLSVGPESAGAYPGPACYGQGGVEATVTDADVVLGIIDPEGRLGGSLEVQPKRAREAVHEHVAKPLGMADVEAAAAIYNVVTSNMAVALRMQAAERGKDFRRYDLLAFGGAGPVHAYGLARELGIKRIICPAGAGVLSAYGLLVAPVLVEISRSAVEDLNEFSASRIEALYVEMLEAATAQLASFGMDISRADLSRSAEMRYVGQGYELEVPLPAEGRFDSKTLASLFHDAYFARYNLSLTELPVEALSWRLTARIPTEAVSLNIRDHGTSGSSMQVRTRTVFMPDLGRPVECTVHRRADLPAGAEIDGPSIIEEMESTALVGPGAHATIDLGGNLVIDLA